MVGNSSLLLRITPVTSVAHSNMVYVAHTLLYNVAIAEKYTYRTTDRQFIQTYTYITSSQHKLYNEICHVYLHICIIKNEHISVSLTVTIEKKNILHTH